MSTESASKSDLGARLCTGGGPVGARSIFKLRRRSFRFCCSSEVLRFVTKFVFVFLLNISCGFVDRLSDNSARSTKLHEQGRIHTTSDTQDSGCPQRIDNLETRRANRRQQRTYEADNRTEDQSCQHQRG